MITLDIFTPFAGTGESTSSYLSKLIVFSVECFVFKKGRSWNPPLFVLSSSVQAPELTFMTAGVDLFIVTASFIVIARTLACDLVILKEGFQRIPTLGLTEDALFRLKFFGTEAKRAEWSAVRIGAVSDVRVFASVTCKDVHRLRCQSHRERTSLQDPKQLRKTPKSN